MLVERERADLQESALEAIRAISADDDAWPNSELSGFVVLCVTKVSFRQSQVVKYSGNQKTMRIAFNMFGCRTYTTSAVA